MGKGLVGRLIFFWVKRHLLAEHFKAHPLSQRKVVVGFLRHYIS